MCTVRYNYRDLTGNNGDCVELPVDIGRPSISEAYHARPVTGSCPISAFLPVIWFIEPASGATQFCALRHAGACVRLTLPRSVPTTGNCHKRHLEIQTIDGRRVRIEPVAAMSA